MACCQESCLSLRPDAGGLAPLHCSTPQSFHLPCGLLAVVQWAGEALRTAASVLETLLATEEYGTGVS